MRTFRLFFLPGIIILLLSCDEYFVIIKCSDCLETEPTEANILIETENSGNFKNNIMIYEGNLEDSILLSSFYGTGSTYELTVKVNKMYTCKVEYTAIDGKKYVAVNSLYPRVKLDSEQCENYPCYYIYNNKLNMHLKYE